MGAPRRHGVRLRRGTGQMPVLRAPVLEAVPGRRPKAERLLSDGHVLWPPRTSSAGHRRIALGPAEQSENVPGR